MKSLVWRELIFEIQKIEEKYGGSLRKSASNEEIKRLQKAFLERMDCNGKKIPDHYLELLKTVNGLDFNGLVLYGTDHFLLEVETDEEFCGFLETNEIWHENESQRQYMFFGDSNTAWYCLDVSNGMYLELDKPSGTVMKTYGGFFTMLEDALKTATTE